MQTITFNAAQNVTYTGKVANFNAGGNHNNAAHWAAINTALTAAKNKTLSMGALVAAQHKAHPTNLGNARPFLLYCLNARGVLKLVK